MKQIFERWDELLRGWPDGLLTVILVAAALLLVLIAFNGSPTEKAIATAYVTLP